MNNLDNKYIISYRDYKNFNGILTGSSKQEKEFINPLYFFMPNDAKVENLNNKDFVKTLFKTRRVNLPHFNILDEHVEKYNRFEEFTKRDEVNNIALWILSSLKYLSNSSDLLLGKELEIIQSKNPRDGRLDVVAIKTNRAVIIETKTDLKSTLIENRFLYQIPNYEEECVNSMKKHRRDSKVLVLLGIGGEESDLFPPDHPDCTTGIIGNSSSIFYDKLIEKNIQFVSANALWCLVAYNFITGAKIDLFDFLLSIFSENNILGLLSGGVVKKTAKGLIVIPIELDKLSNSS